MKKIKKDLLFIIIILITSFYFWKHIPWLQFQGEGFTYFEKDVAKFRTVYPPIHDNFARLFFLLVADVFKENTYLYMSFMLLYMLLIDVIFYLIIRKILNKKTAFIITALFSLSMIANYDIFSNGGYQYFIQRVTPLPLILIAFAYMISYLNKPIKKYYFASLLLYLTGIWLGFFGTWFLPAFIFYPVFKIVFSGYFKEQFFNFFWVPLPFIIGNLFLIKSSGYANPEASLIYLLVFKTGSVFSGVLEQLNVITLPLEVLKVMNNYLQKYSSFSKESTTLLIGFLTLTLYALATFIIIKFNPKLKTLTITSLFTIIAMLVLNLYLNSATVLNVVGSSRYFYYVYFFIAIFWGLFFATVINHKQRKIKYLSIIIFALIILNNYFLLQCALKEDKWRHEANWETIEFLSERRDIFKASPNYVYLPSSLGAYGNAFALRYFSHPDGYFRLESLEAIDYKMLIENNVDPGKLFFLHFDPTKQKVVDLTNKVREEYLEAIKK